MFDQNFLSNSLRHYKWIALSSAALMGLAIGVVIILLAMGLKLSVLQGGLLFLALISAVVSVGVLSLGFTSFKKRVLLDLDTQKARFASVNVDALTGALVRSYFLTQLQALMKQAHTEPVGYVQIDMDHFKGLNDGNGHAVGDAALAYLVAQVRDVLPQALVGRLGGDEFGVAVIGCSSGAALKTVCDQIRVALAKPVWLCGHYVRLGASMGIALAPAHADRVDDLISKADLALYKCKDQGRNSVVIFEEDMHRDERHRRFIERELRAAILVNQLELYYQPIYSTDGKTLRSYESLVRWQHPVRGTIAPDDFIHIAEKSDLIDKLGDWVLRRACADIKVLKAPKIAVNVSAAQLKRTDFAARFTAILEETGTAGNLLTVEITETVPLVADGREKANLEALRALGVSIAIDDFGAGNASLDYIKRFSFDVLKIDRSYVQGITESRIDAMMVGAICRIARSGGMEVVAEGVETEAQLLALRQLKATAVQGYYLGRPEPLWRIVKQAVPLRDTRAVAA